MGEYLILFGGPALVIATTPRFKLKVFESKKSFHPFHPKSPAGLLLKEQNLKNIFFEFSDPYFGSGGMGASSAQFVLIHSYLNLKKDMSWQALYKSYRAQSSGVENWRRPSGGDVIAQFMGGISSFHPRLNSLENLSWSFSDLEFSLFKTSQKLATHLHLNEERDFQKDLQKPERLSEVSALVEQASAALKACNSDSFIEAFAAFSKILESLKLVAVPTQKILKALRMHSEVLASKGCGAMGVDVICVLHRPEHKSLILAEATNLGLKFLANHKQLDSAGFRIDSEASLRV